MNKKALFIATVGGFVSQFERSNISILHKKGYEVHLAANFKDPVYRVREQELMKSGVIFHQISIAKSPYMVKENFQALKQLCRIIKKEAIDLIHCHTPVGGMLGRLSAVLCYKQKPVVIYTAHGFHFYAGAPLRNWIIYYSVEKLLARFTDYLITINEEDARRASHFKLHNAGQVFRIPGEGLELGDFCPMQEEDKKRLRHDRGIGEDVFFILSVGELSGNKNHIEIIELIPDLVRELPGCKILYGICGDGFFYNKLEEDIYRRGLQEEVHLFGYRDDIPQMLACADCFVFPSIREGLGMAALEALAMKIPVVASNNRGTREYLLNGVNGLVCDIKQPKQFIEAIISIYKMGEQECSIMKERGRMTAERFRQDYSRAAMENVYDQADKRVDQAKKTEPVLYVSKQRSGNMQEISLFKR